MAPHGSKRAKTSHKSSSPSDKAKPKKLEDLTKKVQTLSRANENLQKTTEDLRKVRDNLLSQLECPVCLETCLPPITMCLNGHNVCSTCVDNLKSCPTCRAPDKPNIKNIFGEKFITQYGELCKNKNFGCRVFVMTSDMAVHLLDCEYRYKCYNCKEYLGDLSSLRCHTAARYEATYHVGTQLKDIMSVSGSMKYRHISCYNRLFRCALFLRSKGLCMYVWYFGPREHAAKYKCWFEFFSEDEHFKCSYLVRCWDTSVEFNTADAIIVDNNNYSKLKRKDGTISFKIDILESVMK